MNNKLVYNDLFYPSLDIPNQIQIYNHRAHTQSNVQ
jgi:hypothetical protein